MTEHLYGHVKWFQEGLIAARVNPWEKHEANFDQSLFSFFACFWNWIFLNFYEKYTYSNFLFWCVWKKIISRVSPRGVGGKCSDKFRISVYRERSLNPDPIWNEANGNWYPTKRHPILGKNREKQKLRTTWMGQLYFVSVPLEVSHQA